MSDEDLLRSVFKAATADLEAPELHLRPQPTVVPMTPPPATRRRDRTRRAIVAGGAAITGAAAALAAVLGLGVAGGKPVRLVPHPSRPTPGISTSPGTSTSPGQAALYQLASAVRAQPAPSGRYAVQIERQTENTTSYLKATVIDALTGDTWTYQKGPGVPSALPMAPGFSPTEAELRSLYPTGDPTRLRAALEAQNITSNPHPIAPQTAEDRVVSQAIDTLWNPLVQPALRAALVSVVASSPGVSTDPHATDARGRKAIEVSHDDAGTGMRLSVYLDPSTGAVLEGSEQPYAATANPDLAGTDLYLSQYWTDASPTVDPLTP